MFLVNHFISSIFFTWLNEPALILNLSFFGEVDEKDLLNPDDEFFRDIYMQKMYTDKQKVSLYKCEF